MKSKRVILVPYNFKLKSERALENAIHLAHYLDARIHLLNVVPSGDFISELFRNKKEMREAIRKTKDELTQIAKKVSNENCIKIDVSVEAGNPESVILEMAEHINAVYIVMGKNIGGSNHFFFLATRSVPIITKAPCPVIMTSEQMIKDEGFKNIVLPLDLSKQTLEKVQKAILWGRYYKSTIHLVGILSGGVPAAQSQLHKQIEKAKTMISLSGLSYTEEIYKMSDTPVHEQILAHAKKVNGDLLMIMTHQEKCETDTYIGKVAQNIIKYAEMPVVSFTSAAMCSRNHFMASFTPIDFLTQKLKNDKVVAK